MAAPAHWPPSIAVNCLAAGIILYGVTSIAAETESLPPEPPVKLSRSGICHDHTSPNYRQLTTYDPFDSVEACRAAGGRLPGSKQALPYVPQPANPPWWKTVDWGYLIGSTVVVLLIGGTVIYPWYSRWRTRRVLRRAEDAARRRWEGHRLDPRDRDKPR